MRTVLAPVAAMVVALVVTELVMRPAMGTRVEITVFLGVTAAVAAVIASRLQLWVRHGRRLRLKVLALATVAVLLVAGAVTAAAGLMFISSHDLRLLWIVVGFALTIAVIVAGAVSAALTDDLQRIADTAREVGAGRLGARTGVDRRDEVGTAAAALDEMSARLEEIEEERRREQEARQGLLRSIGHDLRTPLSALQAAVEAMQDGVLDDPSRYLGSMEADVTALTALVDDLFVLTKIEAGQVDFEAVELDLADLADETIQALRPTADAGGIDLTLRTKGHVSVVGGPVELSRVIRNLVDNAIHHSPSHGSVVVEVEANGMAQVIITDDGPGFSPEFIDQAFESFTRHDAARSRGRGGSGLGLAIAHGLVAAHGGRIWAEPGPGGRVSFTIPIVRAGAIGKA